MCEGQVAHEVAESNLSRLRVTRSARDVERSRMERTRFREVPIGDWFGVVLCKIKIVLLLLLERSGVMRQNFLQKCCAILNRRNEKPQFFQKTNEGIA